MNRSVFITASQCVTGIYLIIIQQKEGKNNREVGVTFAMRRDRGEKLLQTAKKLGMIQEKRKWEMIS